MERLKVLMIKILRMVVMLAGVIFSACSNDDDSIVEELTPTQQTYTLTVNAGKESSGTRGLSLEGKTLNAVWKAGEQVTVVNFSKFTKLEGYLEVQNPGSATAQLSGNLTGTIEPGDVLQLEFLTPDFAGQDGTLEYIESHCDYAVATVTVTSVDGGIVTTTNANFANQRTIVKFKLKNADGTANITPERFAVKAGNYSIRFVPTTATNEFFVCFPGISSQEVDLVATQDGLIHTFAKTGVTFAIGQYYEITARLKTHTYEIGANNRVYFSQGNLKYDGSKWSFHTNQYDHVGTATGSYPMDLFTWGNIANPTRNGSTYITGEDNLDGVNDWGYNAISNGGNQVNMWATMSLGNWDYLFHGRTDAASKYALGKVVGINGLIILPQNYTGTALNTNHKQYTDNEFDATAWVYYEAHGAVFLPAAGVRHGEIVTVPGEQGLYWTINARTKEFSNHAWHFWFHTISANSTEDCVHTTENSDYRYMGHAVRLVRNADALH